MDQLKSRVFEINLTSHHRVSSGIQQTDALETLLIYLIGKFGPLTSRKLFELVSCFGPHGIIPASFAIEKIVSITLQKLMLEQHVILYRAEFGNWNLNKGSIDSLEEESVCEIVVPRFILRNVIVAEQSLNVKGVGDEFVYAVYHSESRIESVLRNRENWLLKVGRTNNLKRRVAQLSESGPNSLVIGVAFRTYNARGLEKHIHQALHSREKACAIPGRREWFYSNLVEISRLQKQFKYKSQQAA